MNKTAPVCPGATAFLSDAQTVASFQQCGFSLMKISLQHQNHTITPHPPHKQHFSLSVTGLHQKMSIPPEAHSTPELFHKHLRAHFTPAGCRHWLANYTIWVIRIISQSCNSSSETFNRGSSGKREITASVLYYSTWVQTSHIALAANARASWKPYYHMCLWALQRGSVCVSHTENMFYWNVLI